MQKEKPRTASKSRKEATPFHLPGHVSANGYYQHDLWPGLPNGSFVYKGRWMGNNRVRGRDRELVERGELNGAETNLKKLQPRRMRYASCIEYRARTTRVVFLE